MDGDKGGIVCLNTDVLFVDFECSDVFISRYNCLFILA